MTDSRLSAIQTESLTLPDSPSRRLSSTQVETLVQASDVQRILSDVMVEILSPVVPDSPVPPGIVSVGGAQDNPIHILHSDGSWRVLRTTPLQ